MSGPQKPFYLVALERSTYKSWYAQGIRVFSIPFETAESVQILRLIQVKKTVLYRNLLPAMRRLQSHFRAWFRDVKRKAIQGLLHRELTGQRLDRP